MESINISFSANRQTLTGGGLYCASNTVHYIIADFELGDGWDGFDSVRAVWSNDFKCISTVLDPDGSCTVPHEVLERRGKVSVNLVGSVLEDDELTDRLTTYPVLAITVDANAKICGTETAEVTPSQFEQFVNIVHDEVAEVTGMSAEATTLPEGSEATASYSDGVLSFGIPKGDTGETGNGIESIVMTEDYDLIITYTDESVVTVPTGLDAYKALLEGYKDDTYGYMQSSAGSASDASADALKAEGYAVGKQNGTSVASGSPYYENNAKYYATQAAASAASLVMDTKLNHDSTNAVQNKVITQAVTDLKEDLRVTTGMDNFSSENFEQGYMLEGYGWNGSGSPDANKYISFRSDIKALKGTKINISCPSHYAAIYIFNDSNWDSVSVMLGAHAFAKEYEYILNNDGYILITIATSDVYASRGSISPSDYAETISLETVAMSTVLTATNILQNGGFYVVPVSYTNNGYIRDSSPGDAISYNNWKYTDYIEVNPKTKKLKIVMLSGGGTETLDGNIYNAWYNKDKQYIGKLIITNGEILIPESAYYIRLSCRSQYTQNVYLYGIGIADIMDGMSSPTNEYLKCITWNVGIFGDGTTKPSTADSPNQIIEMKKMAGEYDADIINTQEYVDYVDASNTISSANIFTFKYNNKVNASTNKSFSKVGILGYETITFTSGSNRPCIAYDVGFNGKTITIINAHASIELDPSTHRAADIAQLIAYMDTKDYVILTGDLNVASDSEYNAFKTAGYTLCNGGDFGWFDTWPVNGVSQGTWPTTHLDNIIVSSNIVPQFVEALEVEVSDHAPLYAVLKIN